MSPVAYVLVDTQNKLKEACRELEDAERVHLDTEFEGRRDGSTLCLVQIQGAASTFLIDTLLLRDLSPLARVLNASSREWVVHAGQQDVALLCGQLGVPTPARLFDTQAVWALVSPEYSVSLSYLLFRLLGLVEGKNHQADDWKRRPLPQTQLAYAASDVIHLPALRRKLLDLAEELGRAEFVGAVSRELVCPDPTPPRDLSLATFRNAWQLDRPRQAALGFIINWYNNLDPAERTHAPEPKTLLAIASRLPETAEQLGRIKGVSRKWRDRWGGDFTRQLLRASQTTEVSDFVSIECAPYATFEGITLDAWLIWIRARLCCELRLAPELALPTRLFRQAQPALLASRDPYTLLDALSDWRRALLEQPYRRLCQEPPVFPLSGTVSRR